MSEFGIKPGLVKKDVYEVKEEHIPKCHKEPIPVLSTPVLISMMEDTSMFMVEDLLPDGYTTVGMGICMKHLRPVPVGAEIEVVSVLKAVEGRKLSYVVEAFFKTEKIAEGEHERFIINRKRFIERIPRP